jgi:AraC-like DNA-binding protein
LSHRVAASFPERLPIRTSDARAERERHRREPWPITEEKDMMRSRTPVFDFFGSPEGDLYEAWLEEVCREFCRFNADSRGAEEVNWQIDIAQVSTVSFARAEGTGGRFSRTRELIADAFDDFVLTTAISGDIVIMRGEDGILLRESEMCLMDMSVPCGVSHHNGDRFTSARIPRNALLLMCPGAENRLFEPIKDQRQLRELIIQYFSLSGASAASLDEAGQRTVAHHMIDLVALLLRAGGDEAHEATQRGHFAARLRSIQRHVIDHLDDSGLTISQVAGNCGLSPKQVQRLFERAGTTFTEFLLEQRLLLARRQLSGPGHREEKIGSLAYGVGFGDLSYFNRAFRQRFNMTPSEWRNSQQVGLETV